MLTEKQLEELWKRVGLTLKMQPSKTHPGEWYQWWIDTEGKENDYLEADPNNFFEYILPKLHDFVFCCCDGSTSAGTSIGRMVNRHEPIEALYLAAYRYFFPGEGK